MSNILKFKSRLGSSGAPSALKSGEPAYNHVEGKMYVGVGNDGLGNATSIVEVAGSSFAKLATPAFTGNPTAPTQAEGNNSTRLATTAYADRAATAVDTSYLGVKTTSQRDVLSPSAGDWIKNSTNGYRTEVYTGSCWVSSHDVVLYNRTGSATVLGAPVKMYTAGSSAFVAISSVGDVGVIGVCAVAGIANLTTAPLAVTGKALLLFDVAEYVVPGDPIKASSGGKCTVASYLYEPGVFAISTGYSPLAPIADYTVDCILRLPAVSGGHGI